MYLWHLKIGGFNLLITVIIFVISDFCCIFACGLIRLRAMISVFVGYKNSVCCLFDNNVPEVWSQKEHKPLNKCERLHSVDVSLILAYRFDQTPRNVG